MNQRRAFTAEAMWLDPGDGPRWMRRPWVELDEAGDITAIGRAAPEPRDDLVPLYDLGAAWVLPGLVNAHSHAFQRGVRGRTERMVPGVQSSFWGWRQAMYDEAGRLEPETLFDVTRACFHEMLRGGITCVGEFHYLHHQHDGQPYDQPNELGYAVAAAAADVGVRLTLLDAYYARSSHEQPPRAEQRRFCDASLDAYLARIDGLRTSLVSERVRVGLAPHSVRAVPKPALATIAEYAADHDLVVHAHVSEQPRENEECLAEHGGSPTSVLADAGLLDRPRRFTAVHAIHTTPADRERLASQHVCACPTTEANLGDGMVAGADLLARGATLCLGSDSNSIIDLVQEARLLEMGERLRLGRRLCLQDAYGHVAPVLVDAMTRGGASSLGWPNLGRLAVGTPFDATVVDREHLTLRDVPDDRVGDALLLAGSSAAIVHVYVAGEQLV
ncbi:MAG: formimidoylglutamate deiminase [Myxococcales bacterium FL481]|nr:MAG: formimidoylglutamate deiminase [Myxococcales bacterium FL481]